MKYFLTLLSVAALVTLVFAFNDNFLERHFANIESRVEKREVVFSVFSKGDRGNGDVIEQMRKVNAFTSVSSSNAINVVLVKGDSPKVVVRTDSNLQDHIKTEVKGNKLKIYVRGNIRKYSEMTVFVTFTELEALHSSSASEMTCKDKIVADVFSVGASSASNIKLENVEMQQINVATSSAANVKIAGKCEKLEVDASSASDANLYKLEAQNVEADASSAADIRISVSKKLEAEASSGADITYKGSPEHLSIEESSGGDISKH